MKSSKPGFFQAIKDDFTHFSEKMRQKPLGERIKQLFLGLSIRLKISLIMIILLSITVLVISNALFNRQKVVLLNEMRQRGEVLGKNLANAGLQSILNKDRLIIGDAVTSLMKEKGVVYCFVVDKRGKIVESSVPSQNGKPMSDEYSKSLGTLKEFQSASILWEGHSVLDIANPIVIGNEGKLAIFGYVRVGMDWDVVLNEIRRTGWNVLILALIILIIGVGISILFATTITRPILQMVQVMKKVDEGDLNQTVSTTLIDEIGKLADAMNEMIQHLREKMMMSKYISKSAQEMISGQDQGTSELKLGGVRKAVTLFFSDIRGFTSYSEKREPEEVISMLNTFLSVQADIIDKNGGSIDKFVGDEVVAVFEGEAMVENAVKSGLEIQKKIRSINEKNKTTIAVGVGLNTGDVVMGNMGSKKRMDYTVLGDNVNTAARLCGAADPGEILATEALYALVKDKNVFTSSREISVKGKSLPLKVYSIKP